MVLMLARPPRVFTPLLALFLTLSATVLYGQTTVYSNQANVGPVSFTAFPGQTEWDDLELVEGGLLSELSLVTRISGGGSQFASGFFDLRVFDEVGNFPQGQPLGVLPFSGLFPPTTLAPSGDGVLIELTGLESLGIELPETGRIGVGVNFDQGFGLIPSGPAEIGASPGGNWLGSSTTERSEFGGGLPYRLETLPTGPQPASPGVGTYNLFETALLTPDNPSSNSSAGVSDDFFRAINFRVERTTEISKVGAYFFRGDGEFFAAIVEASNLFSPPTTPDLSGDNVIASTVFDLTGEFPVLGDGKDVSVDLEATLEPGTYSLVFGSGQFGAAGGSGSIRFGHIPNGEWSPFGVRQSDGAQSFSVGSLRYFVEASSAPGTLQVRPTFDVVAEVVTDDFSGAIESVRLIEGEAGITVKDPVASEDPATLAIFEFPLEDLPADRGVEAVTLELDVRFANIPTQFEVYGFSGDGSAGLQDAAGLNTIVGETNITSTGVTTITIDPLFVESLVGSATHLGLTILPGSTGSFGFETLENGQFGDPPLLTIELSPPIPGDYNGDGVVDAADFAVWRESDGESGLGLAADGNGDGSVDQLDYDVWRANLGAVADASIPSATVPEPGAAALLLLVQGVLAAGTRGRLPIDPLP